MIGVMIVELKTIIHKEDEDFNTFTMPTTNYQPKKGSVNPTAPKLDLQKNNKIEEWSTTKRSYQISITKTEGLFTCFDQARMNFDKRRIFNQDPKLSITQFRMDPDSHKFSRRTVLKMKLTQTHSLQSAYISETRFLLSGVDL